MTTITLPSDIEGPLAEEARKRGTTPESLALDSLREQFVPSTAKGEPSESTTLFDFLSDHIGTVNGTTEALSEHCGARFADGMIEKQQKAGL